MGVVLPVTGFRGATAVEDVVAGALVGMPELVVCISKCVGILFHRCIQAVFEHGFHEGEVHVDIVIKTGIFNVGVIDVVIVPRNRDLFHDDASLVLELGRASIGAADCLAVPSSADFVHEGGVVHLYGCTVLDFGRAGR